MKGERVAPQYKTGYGKYWSCAAILAVAGLIIKENKRVTLNRFRSIERLLYFHEWLVILWLRTGNEVYYCLDVICLDRLVGLGYCESDLGSLEVNIAMNLLSHERVLEC